AILVFLSLFEYLPGTTSDFADRRRLEVVVFQHADYLLCFPGRLLYVPVGVLPQVFAVHVDISVEHVARGLRRRCHVWPLLLRGSAVIVLSGRGGLCWQTYFATSRGRANQP